MSYSHTSVLRRMRLPFWICWSILVLCFSSILCFFFYASMPNLNRLPKWCTIEQFNKEIANFYKCYPKENFFLEIQDLPAGLIWDEYHKKIIGVSNNFGEKLAIKILVHKKDKISNPYILCLGINDNPIIDKDRLDVCFRSIAVFPILQYSISFADMISSGKSGELKFSLQEEKNLGIFSIDENSKTIKIDVSKITYKQAKSIENDKEIKATLKVSDYFSKDHKVYCEYIDSYQISIAVNPIYQLETTPENENMLDIENFPKKIKHKIGEIKNFKQWENIKLEKKLSIPGIDIANENGIIYLSGNIQKAGKYDIEISLFPPNAEQLKTTKKIEFIIYDPPSFISLENIRKLTKPGKLEMNDKEKIFKFYVFEPQESFIIKNMIIPGVDEKCELSTKVTDDSTIINNLDLEINTITEDKEIELTVTKRSFTSKTKLIFYFPKLPQIPEYIFSYQWNEIEKSIEPYLKISTNPSIPDLIKKYEPTKQNIIVTILSKLTNAEICSFTTYFEIKSFLKDFSDIMTSEEFKKEQLKMSSELQVQGDIEKEGENKIDIILLKNNKQIEQRKITVIKNDEPKVSPSDIQNYFANMIYYGERKEISLTDYVTNRYGELSFSFKNNPSFCTLYLDGKFVIDTTNVEKQAYISEIPVEIIVNDNYSIGSVSDPKKTTFSFNIKMYPYPNIIATLPKDPLYAGDEKEINIAKIEYAQNPLLEDNITYPEGFQCSINKNEIILKCFKKKITGDIKIPIKVKVGNIKLRNEISLTVIDSLNMDLKIKEDIIAIENEKIIDLKAFPSDISNIKFRLILEVSNFQNIYKDSGRYRIYWKDAPPTQLVPVIIETPSSFQFDIPIPKHPEKKLGKYELQVEIGCMYKEEFIIKDSRQIEIIKGIPSSICIKEGKYFRISDNMEMKLYLNEQENKGFLIDVHEVTVSQYKKISEIHKFENSFNPKYIAAVEEKFHSIFNKDVKLPDELTIYCCYTSDTDRLGDIVFSTLPEKIEISKKDILTVLKTGPAFYYNLPEFYKERILSLYPDGEGWLDIAGTFPDVDISTDREDYPMIGISWIEANAYAKLINGRLPKTDEILYVLDKINLDQITPKSLPKNDPKKVIDDINNKSTDGLNHFIGNVSEWLDDGQDTEFINWGWSFDPSLTLKQTFSKKGLFRKDSCLLRRYWLGFRCVIPLE